MRTQPKRQALLAYLARTRAVEAAADAMFCREAREETTAAQRRADAVRLLAERAMAAGFGGTRGAATNADRAEGGAAGAGAGDSQTSDHVSAETRDGADTDVSAERSISGNGHEPGPDASGADSDVSAERSVSADSDGSAETPLSGTRAERYQVFLHVGPDTLRAGGEGGTAPRSGVVAPRGDGVGLSHLEDGTRLAAETARRLCCDAALDEAHFGA